MRADPEHYELLGVSRLRGDVDLGLRMAERLNHMGETGSALRLVEHLRGEVASALGASLPAAPSRWRRSLAIGGLAAVVGISSAAALVAPTSRPQREPAARPSPVTANYGDELVSRPVTELKVPGNTNAPARVADIGSAAEGKPPAADPLDPAPDPGIPVDPVVPLPDPGLFVPPTIVPDDLAPPSDP